MSTYQKFLDVTTFLAASGTVFTILSFIVRLFFYRRTSATAAQHADRRRFANSPKRAGVSFVFAVAFYAAAAIVTLTSQKAHHLTLKGTLGSLNFGMLILLIVSGAFFVLAVWPTLLTAAMRNQWVWVSVILLCAFTGILLPMVIVVFYTWSPTAKPAFAAVT